MFDRVIILCKCVNATFAGILPLSPSRNEDIFFVFSAFRSTLFEKISQERAFRMKNFFHQFGLSQVCLHIGQLTGNSLFLIIHHHHHDHHHHHQRTSSFGQGVGKKNQMRHQSLAGGKLHNFFWSTIF